MSFITNLRQCYLATPAIVAFAFANVAHGQMGSQGPGANSSSSTPTASAALKRIADRTDPIGFLLDKKKQLQLSKPAEDTLKKYRDEMRHMQDIVYKDLDKAALKKEQGLVPSPGAVANLVKEANARVTDIQDAYRDRARASLNEGQRKQIDSLEAIWKRSVEPAAPLPLKKPPPRS